MLALTTLYKVALPLTPPWYRGLPSAALAAVVFLAGSTGLRVYLDWLTATGYTYGALAAPIAFLLATFFIGFAIILGAHLNAAISGCGRCPFVTAGAGSRNPARGHRSSGASCASTQRPPLQCSSNSPTRSRVRHGRGRRTGQPSLEPGLAPAGPVPCGMPHAVHCVGARPAATGATR